MATQTRTRKPAAKLTGDALEEQIAKYKPTRGDDPASGGTLWHLNHHGLIAQALAKSAGDVITKMTAWEVMADAQRAGVVFGAER